ncbi:putative DNA-binding transcriptional regulator AlpA [Paraburkholderia sp. UCT70]|uniref:hypothetical protein n=1 Tax=Paraburkholderia sp. UCT70 TaxID=2991068 RepID=UPI003D1AF918
MKTQVQLLALIANESTSLADAWQAIQDLQTRFVERVARIAIEQRTSVAVLMDEATKQAKQPKPTTEAKQPVEPKQIVIDTDATLISTEHAAHLMGISKKSMSNYGSPSTRAAYNFPVEPQRVGGRVMWDRAAIEALVAERAATQNNA